MKKLACLIYKNRPLGNILWILTLIRSIQGLSWEDYKQVNNFITLLRLWIMFKILTNQNSKYAGKVLQWDWRSNDEWHLACPRRLRALLWCLLGYVPRPSWTNRINKTKDTKAIVIGPLSDKPKIGIDQCSFLYFAGGNYPVINLVSFSFSAEWWL